VQTAVIPPSSFKTSEEDMIMIYENNETNEIELIMAIISDHHCC
jgi:hypothetical protein